MLLSVIPGAVQWGRTSAKSPAHSNRHRRPNCFVLPPQRHDESHPHWQVRITTHSQWIILDVFSNKFCCILTDICLSSHSDTSTQQVIELLLSKFKITDNPKKFALYEKIEDEKGVTSYTHIVLNFVEGFEWFLVFFSVMRKMCPDEQPLPLCLSWGSQGLESHKFVLHENDSGDVIVSWSWWRHDCDSMSSLRYL